MSGLANLQEKANTHPKMIGIVKFNTEKCKKRLIPQWHWDKIRCRRPCGKGRRLIETETGRGALLPV